MIGLIIDTIDITEKPYKHSQFMVDNTYAVQYLIDECIKCPYIQKIILLHSTWKPKIRPSKYVTLKHYFEKNETNWEAVHDAARENGLTTLFYIPGNRIFIPAWLLSETYEKYDGINPEIYGNSNEHFYFHLISFKELTKLYQMNNKRTAIEVLSGQSTTIASELKFNINSLKQLDFALRLKKEGYDILEIVEQLNETNEKND